MNTPKTEMRNLASMHLDRMSTFDMAQLVVTANYEAVKAVEHALPALTQAIEAVTEAFEKGNRLFYVGAGTSGRLGVLDAAECPPTFGVPQGQVCGIIAGGRERMFRAGESEEDRYDTGYAAIRAHDVIPGDIVVGLSAAGNAAYVVGALEAAKELGCVTVGVSSNPDTAILSCCDIPIFTDTGPEVLTGSTRLKAGTAQKIVLNTLSTCAMAKTGKVYENMMINLSPSNEKLKKRVIRITSEILSCTEEEATAILEQNDWNIRKSIETAKKE